MNALYDVPAPAKLNLFLHVVGKRADGYHLLQSVFTLIDWADTLHFERRADGQLARHDRGASLPEDDLCLRAARLLREETGCTQGADILIDKRLPSGAGMGGGSSDAASTLIALNRLWGLNLSRRRLLALGLKLGADVPFFIGGQNALVEGIGEQLRPVTLPPMQFAVLKPPVSISTQQIFSSPLLAMSESLAIVAGFPASNDLGLNPGLSLELSLGLNAGNSLSRSFGRNDLQNAAEAASQEVVEALNLLKKTFGNSRMTGSGSAVFARVNGEKSILSQALATLLQGVNVKANAVNASADTEASAGWQGEICRSLDQHPLKDWVDDGEKDC
ncbi:MAG TPA: 4-(cytidine 5'-diphospho)-2-C-methyl-D-erythritol kinase [Burkholderiaceae bacterium]|jgi:4-diphosphocytidyl-2-C-methyl-D-erythritol kinase